MADGEAFLLQAGDCAESFAEFNADSIRDKLKIILQMAVALTYAAGVPVVKVGRIAGQFAKPAFGRHRADRRRGAASPSAATWSTTRPSTPRRARPTPSASVAAYQQSASTLNLLRAFTKGGFADLSQVHLWNQQFVASSSEGQRYERIAAEIDRALRFMAACGIDLGAEQGLHQVDFFTSHEALILPYEECLTRVDSLTGDWYDCSAHMVWVGDRTRQLDGAHLEFLARHQQPGRREDRARAAAPARSWRCASGSTPTDCPAASRSSPAWAPDRIAELLPAMVRAVEAEGHAVVWACDPMHGNTFTSEGGRKTRRFDDILSELRSFFDVHRDEGTWPGGVARRADRGRRDRVPRRRRGDLRRRPRCPLHDDVRPQAERPAVARPGFPRGGIPQKLIRRLVLALLVTALPLLALVAVRRHRVGTSGRGQSATTPAYWLAASDGGIFSFGGAPYYGSTGGMVLNKPVVGMAATADGGGYYEVASDGGVFSYGDAVFYGSTGSIRLNQPIVGMAVAPGGGGYWLVASDGGIFSYGDAIFYGSTGGIRLNKPVVGMAATPSGHGYWLVASDGGIFSYGDASFYGSTGSLRLNKPIIGMITGPGGCRLLPRRLRRRHLQLRHGTLLRLARRPGH